MKKSSHSSPAIIIYLSFVAHLMIPVHALNTTLITQACNQTPNYNLCVSTLNSDPKTRVAKDESDLAIIMVLHVNGSAIKTRDHIFGYINDPSIDEPTKQLLTKCNEKYNQMITYWLVVTIDGISAKNYVYARDSMGVVPMYVESCEESFKAPIKSPISVDSKATDDLSKVALAIVSALN